MSWIGYLIFGLVAGAIARLIHPGKDSMNWIWTMLLGIGGAMVGGYIGSLVGVGNNGLMGWVLAIGGAILLLVIFHAVTARSAAVTSGGGTTNDDYKAAVFNDLSKGPRD